jgi:hypothetical protein
MQSDELKPDEQTVCCRIPSAMMRPKNLCWKVLYPIYGLRCAPSKWVRTRSRLLQEIQCVDAGHSVYLWGGSTMQSAKVILLCHVDDSLILCRDGSDLEFLPLLHSVFNIGKMNQIVDQSVKFLGMMVGKEQDAWTVTCLKKVEIPDPTHVASVRGQLNWLVTICNPQLSCMAAQYQEELARKVARVESATLRLYPLCTSSPVMEVYTDSSHGEKARRGCLFFLHDPGVSKGALVQWTGTSLGHDLGSSASELQGLESASGVAARLYDLLLSHGICPEVKLLSDATVLLYQVAKGKQVGPPLQRYVPTIQKRMEYMGAVALHVPGKRLPADVMTKLVPTKEALESLSQLMNGILPLLEAKPVM